MDDNLEYQLYEIEIELRNLSAERIELREMLISIHMRDSAQIDPLWTDQKTSIYARLDAVAVRMGVAMERRRELKTAISLAPAESD